MIEVQISEFIMNLGLTSENFEESEAAFSKCYDVVKQHIMAIEDFNTFRMMMFARNTQLNLQALREMEQEKALLNQKTQLTSNSDEASGHSNRGGPQRIVTSEESEEEALRRAIEESEKEAKKATALDKAAKKLKH